MCEVSGIQNHAAGLPNLLGIRRSLRMMNQPEAHSGDRAAKPLNHASESHTYPVQAGPNNQAQGN